MVHISKLYLVINGFLYFPSFQASTVKDKGLGCPSADPLLLALLFSEHRVVHARARSRRAEEEEGSGNAVGRELG
jgi:hypothetical protein